MATSVLQKPATTERPPKMARSGRAGTTRVLHVINGEHYSGAERVQDLLAGELPECGFQVGLACVKPDQFPKNRQNTQAVLYEIPMRGRFDLRPVKQLVSIIRRGGYELLHAHTPRSLMLAVPASLLSGVPLVYHVHSPTWRDSTHRLRNLVNALIERVGLVFASAAITVSQSLGKHIQRQGISTTRVSVVPNGVPCRRPRPVEPVGGKSHWTLGTVALFRPRKGIEVLLEAIARLRREGLQVRLRAVGSFESADYERQIKNLTEKLDLVDAVDWTGFTRDVDAELARMDLFVLPSLFGEGLPMVVLEAMAAGVPVVATRVEGVPEAIRHGENGLLVEPGDPDSLAQVISTVTGGRIDWSKLRAGALKRHAEEFSARRMAEDVAEVYRRVLGKSDGRG